MRYSDVLFFTYFLTHNDHGSSRNSFSQIEYCQIISRTVRDFDQASKRNEFHSPYCNISLFGFMTCRHLTIICSNQSASIFLLYVSQLDKLFFSNQLFCFNTLILKSEQWLSSPILIKCELIHLVLCVN
jgi:hypothetical protein